VGVLKFAFNEVPLQVSSFLVAQEGKIIGGVIKTSRHFFKRFNAHIAKKNIEFTTLIN
jgi:hypothetical protein